MQATKSQTNAARETGQPIIRKTINGMPCERIRRGVWNVMETKGGQKTGRVTFTGSVKEIEAI